MKFATERLVRNRSEEERLRIEDRGSFLASGMIAGESIMGILLAVTFLSGISSFTALLTGSEQIGLYARFGGWLSLAMFAAIAYVLIRIPSRRS